MDRTFEQDALSFGELQQCVVFQTALCCDPCMKGMCVCACRSRVVSVDKSNDSDAVILFLRNGAAFQAESTLYHTSSVTAVQIRKKAAKFEIHFVHILQRTHEK